MEVSTLSGVVIESGIGVVIFNLGGPAKAGAASDIASKKVSTIFVFILFSPFNEGSWFKVQPSRWPEKRPV
jgi:hypothetical protein